MNFTLLYKKGLQIFLFFILLNIWLLIEDGVTLQEALVWNSFELLFVILLQTK